MALIELRATTRQLQLAYTALEHTATVDDLTGLLNRRTLLLRLQNEIDRSCRTGSEFCFLMLDIDHFKVINDQYGHLGGDDVLREIGALLRQRLRSTDYAGRYGGEELSMIMVDADVTNATRVAEAIRGAIAQTRFGNQQIMATASFGLAQFKPASLWKLATLVYAADKALYKAKRAGRNRLEIWPASSTSIQPWPEA